MGSIKYVLSDSTWWFSVVIVGLLISVLANFVVIWLKYIWLKVMNKYANNTDARRKRDNEIIEKLKADKHLFIIFILKSIFKFIPLLFLFLAGISVAIMGGILAFVEDTIDNKNMIMLTDTELVYLMISYILLGFLSITGTMVIFANSRTSKIIFTVSKFFLQDNAITR